MRRRGDSRPARCATRPSEESTALGQSVARPVLWPPPATLPVFAPGAKDRHFDISRAPFQVACLRQPPRHFATPLAPRFDKRPIVQGENSRRSLLSKSPHGLFHVRVLGETKL